MKITINVNWRSSVILTEAGANVINSYMEKETPYLTSEEKALIFGKDNFKKGDVFKGPLWDTMRIFGDSFYNGCDIPFLENKILIDDKV